MEFRNCTRFPALAYEAFNQFGNELHVVALRVTFDLLPDYSLAFAAEQGGLVLDDEFFGDSGRSSVRQESDLAPFKPRCDVVVNGTAHAPGGIPAASFNAGIRITNSATGGVILEKNLTVAGPRWWKENGKGWEITAPEPIEKLPLRYEFAYGGENRIGIDEPAAGKLDEKDRLTPEEREQHPGGPERAPAAQSVYEYNHLGMGFYEKWYLDATRCEQPQENTVPQKGGPGGVQKTGLIGAIERLISTSSEAPVQASSIPVRTLPAPQIESPDDPVKEIGKRYAPQGFGFINKIWLPRRKLFGTVDREFMGSGKRLPDDFDFAYWNGAHPDMQIPYLQGDETIELANLLPGAASAKFTLPGYRAYLIAQVEGGLLMSRFLKIDTLIIDTDNRKITLVHRALLAKEAGVRVIETRVMNREEAKFHDSLMKEIEEKLKMEREKTTGGNDG